MEVKLMQHGDAVFCIRADGDYKDFEYFESDPYLYWCNPPFYTGYKDVLVLPEEYLK